ncbi:LysR family transcriptional regulator [Streptomyces sp. MS19]|uniref:LysR family transcriptional regulator n=1 Tax=Streptomyces sp. MS19 TaxID=3385972 RepID=UPI0039A132EE
MDLSLLRTFVAVYRAGSVTLGARQVGLAQPTATAQIRALEEQLGQQLFERLARGVAPTAVADELAAEVAPHVDALAAVVERGLERSSPFSRPMHLAGPAELTTTRVLPALAPLVGQGLRLRISLGLSDDLLAGLSAGRFDLVVSTTRPRVRAVTAVPLADEEFVLVSGREWAARIDRDALTDKGPGRLADVPLLSYAEDLPVIRRYWRTLFGTHPRGTAAVVVPDLRGVLAATIAGAGISVLPRYLCDRELGDGTLVALLEPEVPPINTLYLAHRTGTEHTPNVAAVRTHLLMQARLW